MSKSAIVLREVVNNARRGVFSVPLDLARQPCRPNDSVAKFAVGDQALALIKSSPHGPPLVQGEQRFVCGVALEVTTDPRVGPDTQGDLYTAAEVANAERTWREAGQQIGLQHTRNISPDIEVVQSWISPVDCTIGGQTVVAGSWLLAVRVLDDALWADVKASRITGFSIGGTATRIPKN